MHSFDIVFLAELSFPGGSSTSLINELYAAKRAGIAVAIKPVRTGRLGRQSLPNAQLLQAIEATNTPILAARTRIHARLLLICHPYLLNEPLNKALGVSADQVGLIAHHPSIDKVGEPQYALQNIVTEVKNQLGKELLVLPVSDAVRRSFHTSGLDVAVWEHNWTNLIDLEAWTPGTAEFNGGCFRIGRHTRPSVLKLPEPELIKQIYPDDPAFEFHFLGTSAELQKLVAPWPSNWNARPFSLGASRGFLRQLHAYSYYHSNIWIEAFGYNILEAMAVGLPVVLPPHFQEVFGTGALYAQPHEAARVYARLKADPEFRTAAGAAAVSFAQEHHGLDQYAKRVERLIGSKRDTPARARSLVPERVLVVTSNGVGVGHISRQLAIAGEQPLGVQSVFFTLSRSAKFAAQAGYVVEQRAYHKQIDADPKMWNSWFEQELHEALAFYQPDAVVFDGNVPYSGFMSALDAFPEVTRIWTRRGMWRNADTSIFDREKWFDLILEPQDFAGSQEMKFERKGAAKLVQVAPIISVPVSKCLSRETARKLLKLPQNGEVALLQLGASTNFDMSAARASALEALLADPKRHVVELLSPTRSMTPDCTNPRHVQISDYPFFKFHKAFDLVVSACGYNSYHEVLAGGTPCFFVPNNAPEMDLQEVRAEYARSCGWATCARADSPFVLRNRLHRFCNDMAWRTTMSDKMQQAGLDADGAEMAAQQIALAMRTIQVRRKS